MQLHAHHQVVVEELRRVLAVRADAADPRRQVDDQIDRLAPAIARLRRLGQEALDGQAVAEIALLPVGRDELSDTARAECPDHCPAEKTSTARDEDSLVRPRLVVVEPPVGHAGLCNSLERPRAPAGYPMFGTNRRPPDPLPEARRGLRFAGDGCGLPDS